MQVLINRELIRPPRKISDGFDLHLLGDCDDVIRYLCDRLEWELPPPSSPAKTPPATPPLHPPTTMTAPTPAAVDAKPTGGSKEEEGEDPGPLSPPPPTFTPPNSFVFPASEAAGEAVNGSSAAWVALSGGGKSGRDSGDDNDFEEVVTWYECD